MQFITKILQRISIAKSLIVMFISQEDEFIYIIKLFKRGIILHETPQRLSPSFILLLLPLPIQSLPNMHYYQLPYMRCDWDHMFCMFDRVHVGRYRQLPAVCFVLRLLLYVNKLLRYL